MTEKLSCEILDKERSKSLYKICVFEDFIFGVNYYGNEITTVDIKTNEEKTHKLKPFVYGWTIGGIVVNQDYVFIVHSTCISVYNHKFDQINTVIGFVNKGKKFNFSMLRSLCIEKSRWIVSHGGKNAIVMLEPQFSSNVANCIEMIDKDSKMNWNYPWSVQVDSKDESLLYIVDNEGNCEGNCKTNLGGRFLSLNLKTKQLTCLGHLKYPRYCIVQDGKVYVCNDHKIFEYDVSSGHMNCIATGFDVIQSLAISNSRLILLNSNVSAYLIPFIKDSSDVKHNQVVVRLAEQIQEPINAIMNWEPLPDDIIGLGYVWYPIVIHCDSKLVDEIGSFKFSINNKPKVEYIKKQITSFAVRYGCSAFSPDHKLDCSPKLFDPKDIDDEIAEFKTSGILLGFMHASSYMMLEVDGQEFYFHQRNVSTSEDIEIGKWIITPHLKPRERRIFNWVLEISVK